MTRLIKLPDLRPEIITKTSSNRWAEPTAANRTSVELGYLGRRGGRWALTESCFKRIGFCVVMTNVPFTILSADNISGSSMVL